MPNLNTLIASHFLYVFVVRMFHRRKLNNDISYSKNFLRIVYKNYESSFDKLLLKDQPKFIILTYKEDHLNTLIASHFLYVFVVRMFHRRKLNNDISLFVCICCEDVS